MTALPPLHGCAEGAFLYRGCTFFHRWDALPPPGQFQKPGAVWYALTEDNLNMLFEK